MNSALVTSSLPRDLRGFKRRQAPSPSLRLAEVYQVGRPKTALELYRRSCLRVAQGNEVFRSFGLAAVVVDHMAIIDASLSSDEVPPLREALHLAEQADCEEERADEALRYAVENGTLTVDQARAAIKASAMKRCRAEQKERALQRWIDEQKEGR